ncbi:MAG: pentapeptide repeat-containing protein [Anaerolineae bacterium]
MNWDAISTVTDLLSAIGQIAIAGIAVYIAYRQWMESKEDALEQKELTERIEQNRQATMQEQERIIRSQSLDAYFEGVSHLLLREGDSNPIAQRFAKGRTDALLKILKPDEKRDLLAFLYGSGVITLNGVSDAPVISLADSDLSEAALRGAILREASLGMVNLRGADLQRADLSEAFMPGADLRGADLRGADISLAILHGAILSGADVREADLSEIDLSGADLREADLRGAYLTEANLSGANLHGANFTGADLRGANFSGAYLSEANLSQANLSGVQLANLVSISGADFTDAENLNDETREYLCSIAAGTHPVSKRDARTTLGCSEG